MALTRLQHDVAHTRDEVEPPLAAQLPEHGSGVCHRVRLVRGVEVIDQLLAQAVDVDAVVDVDGRGQPAVEGDGVPAHRPLTISVRWSRSTGPRRYFEMLCRHFPQFCSFTSTTVSRPFSR